MRAPAHRPLDALRTWLSAGIHRRVAVALVVLSLGLTLTANTATYLVAREAVRRAAVQHLEEEASVLADRVAQPLSATAAGVAALAANRLLSSALVDSDGRQQYLIPFLRDFQPSAALGVTLTLCDFRGAPIASNLPGPLEGHVGDPWIAHVVDAGRPHAEVVSGTGQAVLRLAFPVRHPETRTPEGFLSATIALGDLARGRPREADSADGPDIRIRILDRQGRILAGDEADRSWAGLLTSARPLVGSPMLDALHLRVEVGTPERLVDAQLRPLAWFWLVGTALGLGAALLFTRLLADRLTAPITRLSAEAARIAGSARLDAQVAVEGQDEIAGLAEAFNGMLSRLRQVTETRVAELQARNDELVAMHHEARRMELELRQAQKLEAVGRLASGIGHEINTPIQFIGDNTTFLKEALDTCFGVIDLQRHALVHYAPGEVVEELDREAEGMDLPYVREQAPRAIDRTLAGTRRVATIVRAMKEFAHPDQREPEATDLNRALESTLEIARNEYKYVATVETELGAIPLVTCLGGDVNQVLLNVIVNAAHAVADRVKGTGQLGLIRVVTQRDGDHVAIHVSDTGGGIPEAVRDKVFEPFFTTKEVGRGTGQGLAISRAVVERHQGTIAFTTQEGIGTTFTIRLPIAGPEPGAAARPGPTPAPAPAGRTDLTPLPGAHAARGRPAP